MPERWIRLLPASWLHFPVGALLTPRRASQAACKKRAVTNQPRPPIPDMEGTTHRQNRGPVRLLKSSTFPAALGWQQLQRPPLAQSVVVAQGGHPQSRPAPLQHATPQNHQ